MRQTQIEAIVITNRESAARQAVLSAIACGLPVRVFVNVSDLPDLDSAMHLLVIVEAPDCQGIAEVVLARRRRLWPHVAVLVAVAITDFKRVESCAQEANVDFVAYPSADEEMLVRMRRLALRVTRLPAKSRVAELQSMAPQRFGSYVFQVGGKILTPGGVVRLSPKAYALAMHMFLNQNAIISRRLLFDAFWPHQGGTAGRVLDTHMSKVRVALGLNSSSGYALVGVYGVGYQLLTTAEAEPSVARSEMEDPVGS